MRRLFHFPVFLLLVSAAFASTADHRERPNIILITIDTVRADHLGCYGDGDVQTPILDSLAHDGVVFDRAISQVPLTWPSHAVILTGTYPFQNGVQDFSGQPLAPQFRSIAQSLKEHGYTTGAVVSAFVLDRSWGLARGFDFYDDAFSSQAFQQHEIGLVERPAGESVTHALKWMRSARRPFFFWLHLYDPHSPYIAPEPYRTQYRDHPYDGEIAYADHELGRLTSWLKQAHLYDRTAIVFLSDHGESLGEHGEDEHGFFIYNATIHVPLIVKLPAGRHFQPKRVSGPVETLAIAPTLLDLAGLPAKTEKQFQGTSLLEHNTTDAAYSETLYPFNSFGWSPLHSLETDRYQYIEAPVPELYDLSVDPQERNNIAGEQNATSEVLRAKLQELLKKNRFTVNQTHLSQLSPDAAEKLRALGYMSYRPPANAESSAASLADPKTKIDEFNEILKAQDALRSGDLASGKKMLADIAVREPKLYTIPFILGETALREQNWTEAVSQFRRCLALNPSFDQAMSGLAHALFASGNSDEARQWLNRALDYNPRNYRAWFELASFEAKSDPAAAEKDYLKAAAIQPNFAPLQQELGMLYYHQKKYLPAADHLARAVALGIADVHTRNFLGISYSQTGQLHKAVDELQAAIAADPNLAEAHLNLAYAYQKLQRRTDAAREYHAACTLEKKFCAFVPRKD